MGDEEFPLLGSLGLYASSTTGDGRYRFSFYQAHLHYNMKVFAIVAHSDKCRQLSFQRPVRPALRPPKRARRNSGTCD